MKKEAIVSVINAMRVEADVLEKDTFVSMMEGECNVRISKLLRKYAGELDGALGTERTIAISARFLVC